MQVFRVPASGRTTATGAAIALGDPKALLRCASCRRLTHRTLQKARQGADTRCVKGQLTAEFQGAAWVNCATDATTTSPGRACGACPLL